MPRSSIFCLVFAEILCTTWPARARTRFKDSGKSPDKSQFPAHFLGLSFSKNPRNFIFIQIKNLNFIYHPLNSRNFRILYLFKVIFLQKSCYAFHIELQKCILKRSFIWFDFKIFQEKVFRIAQFQILQRFFSPKVSFGSRGSNFQMSSLRNLRRLKQFRWLQFQICFYFPTIFSALEQFDYVTMCR